MNNQTITEVSRVTFISGAAKVRTPDGELHDLKVGDILQPGTQVILADASVFVVEATSSEVPGAAAPEAVASTELPADQQPSMPGMGAAAGDDVLAQINQLQQAILAGDDPTQAFEAAAAGVAANAGGRGPGSGNSGFIAVDRVGNATIAAAGYDTAARGAAPIAHFDEPAALIPRGDTTAPLAPTVIITDDVNNDGFLSNAELGNATTVDTRVNLPPDAVVGDTLIISDGITSQTRVLTPDDIAAGFYDTTFARPAEGGTLIVTATVTDAAGNVSPEGKDSAVTDTGTTVAITAITDDTGVNTGDFITNDHTLVFHGTSEAGNRVAVSLNGTLLGIVTADSSGHWSLDYTGTPLADGTYTLSTLATDAAGNTASDSQQVVIDGSTVVDITAITTDSGANTADFITSDRTLVFHGTSEAGNSVAVSLDGVLIGTVTADSNGDWNLDYTGTELADGTYTLHAEATDTAGNTDTDDQVIVVDRTAPTVVVTIVDDINNDTLLSNTELGTDGVQMKVEVDAAELADGGFVTLDIISGASRTVVLYLANDSDTTLTSTTPGDTHVYVYDPVNGIITFTEPVPTEGNTVRVDATQTDLAGNESLPASDYAVLPPITHASGTGWQMNYNKTDNSFDMRVKSPGTATATLYAGATIHWDIIVQDSDHNTAISVLADAEMPASASFHVDELYAADGQTIFRVYMTTSETIQLSEPQGFGIDIQVVDSDGSAYLINSNEYIAPHDNYKEDYSKTFNLTDVLTGHDQEWLSPDTDGGEFTSLTPTPGSGVTDLHYGGGNDAVYGTVYNDGIFGDEGNDFIDGRAGDDTLHGGSGEDVLLGGYGTDTLIGDLGNDILTGGDGADIFKWNADDITSSGAPFEDTITDFSIAQHDMLDLTDVLTNEPANDLTNYLSFGTNTDGDVLVNVHASGDVNITDMTIVIQNPTDTLTELQTYLQNGTGVIHN